MGPHLPHLHVHPHSHSHDHDHSHEHSNKPIVSHGRGGQGNIAPDPTPYVDAGIVREGPYGDQGDGAYSAGRGGAGNINASHIPPTSSIPHDATVVPQPAIMTMHGDADFHVGRGGQGNVHLDPEHAKEKEEKKEEKKEERKKMGWGIIERVKHFFGLR